MMTMPQMMANTSICIEGNFIKNRDQHAEKVNEAAQNIIDGNSGPIRGMTNLVIASIRNACFKVKNA